MQLLIGLIAYIIEIRRQKVACFMTIDDASDSEPYLFLFCFICIILIRGVFLIFYFSI